jgi:hypothetical protein
MNLQFIAVVGFVISIVLCLTAFFLFSTLRGLYGAAQRVFRLRSERTGAGSMTDGCRG